MPVAPPTRAVTAALEVLEYHHAHKVADVQRVGRGVDADVGRAHAFCQIFFGAGGQVVDHAAPAQFFNEIHWDVVFCSCLNQVAKIRIFFEITAKRR